jgi:2'-5' RNA ligase
MTKNGANFKKSAMRVFIAIEMNEEARTYLRGQIRQLAQILPTVRWVDPASIHLTLAFLGEIDEEQLAMATIASARAGAAAHPFTLQLATPGYFGPAHAPRVIWSGLGGDMAALQALHRHLSAELAARGFMLDERPFTPHLTLARVKNTLKPAEVSAFGVFLAHHALRPAQAPSLPVDHIAVMRSELFRDGARYTTLSTHPLGEHQPGLANKS